MKNKLLYLTFTLVTLFACKKGVEDPAFSLLTRRGRLSNDWQIKTISTQNQTTTVITNPNQTPITITSSFSLIFDNSDYTRSYTAPNTNNKTTPDTIITGTVAIHRMSFYKDGTWNREQEYTITYDSSINNTNVKIKKAINTQEQGVWAFLRGTKPDRKDKEELQLSTRQSVQKTVYDIIYPNNITPTTTINETATTTYQDNERQELWRLIGLKGNKTIATIENKPQTDTKTVSQTTGNQPTTSTLSTTVKQLTTILLQD
ncbi:MAG: hypothetical protein H7331_01455 [Bacteroidia bacterium]|nr:hypothetical protein [Bacteroidia bacterium]